MPEVDRPGWDLEPSDEPHHLDELSKAILEANQEEGSSDGN